MSIKTGLHLIGSNLGSSIHCYVAMLTRQVELGSYFTIFITCVSGRTNVIEGESSKGPKYQ